MRTPLKILIGLTICLSLAAPFIPHLQSWLILSWAGIENLYLWQLITYVFIEPGPFSFGFFIQLIFNMYILWMFGSTLIERSHPALFFALYFGAALTAGLASLLIPNVVLAGSTSAVFALIVAWMMVNPGSKLLLFFTLPFKAHWLVVGLVGFAFFVDISSSNWVGVVSLGASVLFGYLFALIVWREEGPFLILRPFERWILRLLEKKKVEVYHSSKIFDIKSGEPVLSDDQFMDAMLDRISMYGEESLTPAEKQRMQIISSKRKK